MGYTVQKLGKLAGISTRTLRYYDEIGILKPERINSSGYRIYGQKEVERLQQILFYRELDVNLESIKNIVTARSFDGATALREHREKLLEKLLEKREQLDMLIAITGIPIRKKPMQELLKCMSMMKDLQHSMIKINLVQLLS